VFIVNKTDSQTEFNQKLKELLSKKKVNSRIVSAIEYETMVRWLFTNVKFFLVWIMFLIKPSL
jgi:hypothetical protein